MNAAEAGTAAEDPFGAAPFRLPPGNHDSLNLCCAHSRPYALSIYFIVWLFIFVFCFVLPNAFITSDNDYHRSEKVTGGGTRWR